MSILASETQNKVGSVRAALQTVETHLEPLLNKSLPEVSRKLAPLENAELQVGLAYTVASLYFCHLLTQGVDPGEHPIRQELDRIQLYFKKVRTTAEEVRDKQAESARMRVDSEAAKRIVQHYTAATDAATQRQVAQQASSSSSGPVPQPVQPAASEGGPPKKRRKTSESGVGAAEGAQQEVDAATGTSAMEGVTDGSDKDKSGTSAVTPGAPKSVSQATATTSSPAEKSPPPVLEEAPAAATAAKPPPPVAPAVPKPPVAKVPAPIAKVPPPGLPAKAPVAKVPPPKIGDPNAAQLRPLAKPMPSAAAKTPQGPAAETILAKAKADAQRAAQKKKKKKALKAAKAAPAPGPAAAVGSPSEAQEDPYGAATDDPYA